MTGWRNGSRYSPTYTGSAACTGEQGGCADQPVGTRADEEADVITDAQVVDARVGDPTERRAQPLRIAVGRFERVGEEPDADRRHASPVPICARPAMSGRTIGGMARHDRFVDVVERQSARRDQLRGRAVATTASREATPRLGEAVLPGGEPRRVGADVLQEEELTIGPQDPDDLAQGELGSVDGAQHERRHDRVDRSVGERQLLRRRLDESCVPAAPAQTLLEAGMHRGVRFGEDELVEVVGVVRQVEAGAAADLHGASARLAEQLPAERAHAGPLAGPHEGVVERPRTCGPRRSNSVTVSRR